MRRSFPYDSTYDPPAPVLPLRISMPLGEAGSLVPALIDTGADCTLIPGGIASDLGLPRIGAIEIVGVGGGGGVAPVHAAQLELVGARILARVVVYGDDVILGRDVVNRVVTFLNGPGLRLRVR